MDGVSRPWHDSSHVSVSAVCAALEATWGRLEADFVIAWGDLFLGCLQNTFWPQFAATQSKFGTPLEQFEPGFGPLWADFEPTLGRISFDLWLTLG